jgi:hypothetical protein
VSNQNAVYQTYIIRFPRRTDVSDAPYLLKDAGRDGYRSFAHLEALLEILQKELTAPSREYKRGSRLTLKDSMDGFDKYISQRLAFWKRKAAKDSKGTAS